MLYRLIGGSSITPIERLFVPKWNITTLSALGEPKPPALHPPPKLDWVPGRWFIYASPFRVLKIVIVNVIVDNSLKKHEMVTHTNQLPRTQSSFRGGEVREVWARPDGGVA
jgi:hypothetical protein